LVLAPAGAATLAAGGAAAWRHAPLIGPRARIERRELGLTAKGAALRQASQALRIAAAEIRAREDQLINLADRERADAADAWAFWKGQCRHAFDAGYAARRCDGGGPDDGVRDLRALQAAGAFKALGRPVPGQPDRAPR
jgi:hypothetical protein